MGILDALHRPLPPPADLAGTHHSAEGERQEVSDDRGDED